jgi:pimeloyl-ACP methyl ester carboxylesterase
MNRTLSALFLLILTSAGITGAAAETAATNLVPDLNKEQRWREQIVDTLMEGQALDLQAGDRTFLGLYTEAAGADGEPSKRAAILVHGIGAHPDWPQVVHPLRVGLPEKGISTLSIQMPVLGNEAKSSDYLPLMDAVAPRLDAAIAFLKEAGAERIAIVAHSLGATMAGDYLASHPGAVDVYVAIGMSGGATQERLDNTRTVGRIGIPMLDLYGQNDLEAVAQSASARAKSAAEGGNPSYNQVQVPKADHFFDGQDQALVDTVSQWLNQNLPEN